MFEHAIQRAEQRLMHSLRSIMGGDTKQARVPEDNAMSPARPRSALSEGSADRTCWILGNRRGDLAEALLSICITPSTAR